jgi:peptidoglycan/xylan/chitin deacetylase (PgdA/CDA1 family)
MALALLFAVLAWQPRWAVDAVAALASGIVWRVPTEQPLVALTFDDGPHPTWTPQVLDVLARSQVQATFFLMGRRARAHPELVARIRAEGHEIGNHTLSHRRPLRQSDAAFLAELLEGEAALGLGPGTTRLFRPPSGWMRPSQRALAAAHGYVTVLGSAYPYDPYRPPVAYMRWVVAKNLRPGAIVVLHDGGRRRERTVEAVAGIVSDGRARGLRWVTVSELLSQGRAIRADTQ